MSGSMCLYMADEVRKLKTMEKRNLKKECFIINISSTINVQESSTFSMHKGFMIQT